MRNDTEKGIYTDSPYLRGDDQLSIFLGGLSRPVLTKLRRLGLPYHRINTIYLYDKDEVRAWINSRENVLDDTEKVLNRQDREVDVTIWNKRVSNKYKI